MTEDISIVKTIIDLGSTGILAIVAWKLYDLLQKAQIRLDDRYQDVKGINKELQTLIKQNVQVNTELKESIKNQTDMLRDIDSNIRKYD
jgi:hypothetical protein